MLKARRSFFKFFGVLLCVILTSFILFTIVNINYDSIKAILQAEKLTAEEATAITNKEYFGKAVTSDITKDASKNGKLSIELKLFNLFHLGKKEVSVSDSKEIYSGGDTVCLNIYTEKVDNFWNDEKSLTGEVSGIGTLSYIDTESLDFGAFGHPLYKDNKIAEVKEGSLSKANVLEIEKSTSGKAGEIRASKNFLDGEMGTVSKNTEVGIFGKITDENFCKDRAKFKAAGRFAVKPGKAKILCQVDGGAPKFYDAKIVKAKKQNKKDVKGMVIQITDNELLSKTGGIVQGMSGSPIFQDGKFIGVVTHLFLNDPTRGYGVYADFMFES